MAPRLAKRVAPRAMRSQAGVLKESKLMRRWPKAAKDSFVTARASPRRSSGELQEGPEQPLISIFCVQRGAFGRHPSPPHHPLAVAFEGTEPYRISTDVILFRFATFLENDRQIEMHP